MERTVTARTELASILVEQARAMARELEAVTDAAPDGAVLAVGEVAAVRLGRELTRVALEAALRPPTARSRRPPIAWSNSAASGSTTRRSAATSTAPPTAWPPAARRPRAGPPSPRPRGRPSSSPTA